MELSVECYLPIICSVCVELANIFMFTVSEENTVKRFGRFLVKKSIVFSHCKYLSALRNR